MPLYEYQCPQCGRFEVIQKFSDPPLATCPTCGCEVHKLLSAPAIQFKGTGWYVTDYARKGAGSEAAGKGAGAEAGKEAAKGSGKEAGAGAKEGGKGETSDSGAKSPKPKEGPA